jgi:hypothetical protein
MSEAKRLDLKLVKEWADDLCSANPGELRSWVELSAGGLHGAIQWDENGEHRCPGMPVDDYVCFIGADMFYSRNSNYETAKIPINLCPFCGGRIQQSGRAPSESSSD